jgi:hypothetical protein
MNENTRWFVEVDSFTNESLSNELNRRNIAAGSDQLIRDENGKMHNAWDVPYQLITMLQRGEIVFPFRFQVFVQEKGRLPRIFNLHRKSKKSTLTKNVLKQIETKKNARA